MVSFWVIKMNQREGAGGRGSSVNATRKYCGPLYELPRTESYDPNMVRLEYDVNEVLCKEGENGVKRRRADKIRKAQHLLQAYKNKNRVIAPDQVIKLQIEERKLRLFDVQKRLRDEVEEEQKDIMGMNERVYRTFVRGCERQRTELVKNMLASRKTARQKELKEMLHHRRNLIESAWANRTDGRVVRNRGVLKYHDKMSRDFHKRIIKDIEDQTERMEALKNNDLDAYRRMLLEKQSQMPGDAGDRYKLLSSFLSQTEEYLRRIGTKITAARRNIINNRDDNNDSLSVGIDTKYYNLAHSVNERITHQPSMLRGGTLRDYQIVGLQWMLSLYNNNLNGILADEMGLGKTVQVIALIAHLMEFKRNYGPHLIIVPNAVVVNWKSELQRWLPALSSVVYVGSKDQRAKLYAQEISARRFNILVTTYEFIMRDRAKLCKVEWKYLVIDEAQRLKDRESHLSRDLDRFQCERRLLLTGTPLQNDLEELWSLLNLLLPEVFDNNKAFMDWFSKPFQKNESYEDVGFETEKKVIVIHRLHQILEPFMLRRRLEDVEGGLPPKDSVVVRCKMSDLQAAIYDWAKATGTLRADPECEAIRVAWNPEKRQVREYVTLQNKSMELRKICNHPFLSYPDFHDKYTTDYAMRCCGKLWVLDSILMKLERTGHRVLLFSTMTQLLDILEDYLEWRGFRYARIDGRTNLDNRESAIVEFNKSGSQHFIFLLSIRAAGRGLNLQSADTVVIYDPDANPKNEEQAVARAHRLGQTKPVKVIYMESVVESISSYIKEDADNIPLPQEIHYVGSVESLVRNKIQQFKIDMANEVINAGRFDQRTTQEERRMTLEALLREEERYPQIVHDVPTMRQINRLIARSPEEVELFDQMDQESMPPHMVQRSEIPHWLRARSSQVNAVVAALSNTLSGSQFVDATSTPGHWLRSNSPSKGAAKSGAKLLIDEDEEMSDGVEE